MKDTTSPLFEAMLELKSRVGNFSAQEYEIATGNTWEFTYDGMEIQYIGENDFNSIKYKNKFMEDDYFTFFIPYVFLEEDLDALQNLYRILKEMESCKKNLQTNSFL